MKGILLAGGAGTRLYPLTRVVSKQLLPIYDKPMIYYPLSVLILASIREILVITTPQDQALFKRLLGDGDDWGIQLSYAVQERPDGIAQAFHIGRDFIGGEACALALVDNLFFGHCLPKALQRAAATENGAVVFAAMVRNPERYGVVTLDKAGRSVALVEKPKRPVSRWAVTGLYFYDRDVTEIAAGLTPSARGELEITDINRVYLGRGTLAIERLGHGYAWLDAGTHQSLLQASDFVATLEERQGLKIACLEEIALRQGWIGPDKVRALAACYGNNEYGRYLMELVEH